MPRRAVCASVEHGPLGLLLPDIRDPVHGQVASAFEQEAREAGYVVLVVAGERDIVRERLALRIFSEHGTDGVAIVSSVLSPKERVNGSIRSGSRSCGRTTGACRDVPGTRGAG